MFEVLDEEECRVLLGTAATGRLGFTAGALPDILPVPFVVCDGRAVIPARRGSPVVSAVRGAVVALQVDSYDAVTRTGWSVTVIGPTRLVIDPEEVAALRPHFSSHPPATDRCYIAVVPGLLRGWRMTEQSPVSAPSEPDDAAEALAP